MGFGLYYDATVLQECPLLGDKDTRSSSLSVFFETRVQGRSSYAGKSTYSRCISRLLTVHVYVSVDCQELVLLFAC